MTGGGGGVGWGAGISLTTYEGHEGHPCYFNRKIKEN